MRTLSKDSQRRLNIALFILPALIVYCFVVIFPIFQSARYSLYEDWQWLKNPKAENIHIGFGNYIKLFSQNTDPNLPAGLTLNKNPFPRSALNAFVLVFLSVFVQLPIALYFALMLSRGAFGEKFYRTIYFIPVILSAVVVGLIWQNIYRTDAYGTGNGGLLNAVCLKLGIIEKEKQWLIDDNSALICAVIPIVWQYIGQHMLLMYAGAKGVPRQLHEAAMIDGATEWQIDTKITIPLMKPILKVSVVWAVTGSLRTFDQLYALLGEYSMNDPNKTVPSLLMYEQIRFFNFGQSSAMAMFIVAECLILTYAINKLFGKTDITY
mgnify:CR=1 FL=1